jgi:hypothetical protein
MIKISYLVFATLVMVRTPRYVSDQKKDIPVISELESDRRRGCFNYMLQTRRWRLKG